MKKLFIIALAALMLLQMTAFAASGRSMRGIDMGDEEFSKLSAFFDVAAIDAWQKANPSQPLNTEQDSLGARIYDLQDENGKITVLADLYQIQMMDISVEEAPEGSLRWLCGASAELRRDNAAASGFAVDSLTLTPNYQASAFVVHENDAAGYELMLPNSFSWPENADNWDDITATSADGKATIRVLVTRDGGETPEESAARLQAEDPALVIAPPSPFSPAVVATAPGEAQILVSAEQTIYWLKLSYPAELEAEYGLIFEILQNSFVISEIAVG